MEKAISGKTDVGASEEKGYDISVHTIYIHNSVSHVMEWNEPCHLGLLGRGDGNKATVAKTDVGRSGCSILCTGRIARQRADPRGMVYDVCEPRWSVCRRSILTCLAYTTRKRMET